ncbi:Vgb family protein [Pseudonocardia alni]|uniref:Vgb family protein n=1 Tax=Pseudonocardia alni TaxID=33907 RepID=UPI003326DFA9
MTLRTRTRRRVLLPLAALAAAALTVVATALTGVASAADQDGRFTFYPVPSVPGGPCVTSPGPDGAAWFLETLAGKLGRIDVATGRIEEYPIPYTGLPAGSVLQDLGLPVRATAVPCALQPGPDGKMYFANGARNQIGSIDPVTKRIELFQAPDLLGNAHPLNDITPGPDNAIWFTQTTAGAIGRFDIATKRFTSYPVPTPASVPVGIYAGPDGGVWFTETGGGKMGRIDPATKRIEEFPTPTPASGPFVVRAQTEDRYIWFTEIVANKVGRLDTRTRQIVEYPLPTPASAPVATCTGSDGNVYISHLAKDSLARLDPSTGAVTEIPLPNSVHGVSGELNCAPGNAVWLIQLAANRVVRYSLEP